jgi:hypothetical protein
MEVGKQNDFFVQQMQVVPTELSLGFVQRMPTPAA